MNKLRFSSPISPFVRLLISQCSIQTHKMQMSVIAGGDTFWRDEF